MMQTEQPQSILMFCRCFFAFMRNFFGWMSVCNTKYMQCGIYLGNNLLHKKGVWF